MRILVAPNSFKNSLDAPDVARAISKGLQESLLSCTCIDFPIGDGGDGTGDLLIERLGAERISTRVSDPFGRSITCSFGFLREKRTAIIEMAKASGIQLLDTRDLNPLTASTFGTGQLIRRALDEDAKKIIVTLGGSATIDGGAGLLRALGVHFLDEAGTDICDAPKHLPEITRIDITEMDNRIHDCAFVVLCDVENTLLGTEGAAAVFGPQKGATATAITLLETGLSILNTVVRGETGVDMASLCFGGAAGGCAAAMAAFFGATLVDGIQEFLQLSRFDEALRDADLVITGEGSLDVQTLKGKGPFGVARRAKAHHLPVIGLAGAVPVEPLPHLDKYFDVLLSIGHAPTDLPTAIRYTAKDLTRTGLAVGNLLSMDCAVTRRRNR
jgi:glycerate kinase